MWRTASTRVTTRPSRLTKAARRVTVPPRHGPDGDLHAYEPGARTTACGLDIHPFRLWPTYSFRRETSRHRCRACVEQVRG